MVSLGRGTRTDFVGGMGAHGDGNRADQVREEGTEGKSTENDGWNEDISGVMWKPSGVETSWNL